MLEGCVEAEGVVGQEHHHRLLAALVEVGAAVGYAVVCVVAAEEAEVGLV